MDDQRTRRIGQEIKKEVSMMVTTELKDPRISPLTSITDVKVTNDLQIAKIYISLIGDDEDKEETLEGLNSSIGYLKKELGRRLSLRHIPDLLFVLDESIEHGIYMNKLIDDVIKKDEENRKKYE